MIMPENTYALFVNVRTLVSRHSGKLYLAKN